MALARATFRRPFVTLKGRSLDGEAEAVLIALWAVRQALGKPVDDLPLFAGVDPSRMKGAEDGFPGSDF